MSFVLRKNMVLTSKDGDLELSKWFGQILKEEDTSFRKRFFLALTSLKEEEWRSLEHLTGILFSKSDNKSENRENP